MAKSSSINTPFSDAVLDHNTGKRPVNDKASPPKNVEDSELYHNEKASSKRGKEPCYDHYE